MPPLMKVRKIVDATELEAAGLVRRIERRAVHKGKLSNEYDLSGLVERLQKIAPEIEKANANKRQVTRRGGYRRKRQANRK